MQLNVVTLNVWDISACKSVVLLLFSCLFNPLPDNNVWDISACKSVVLLLFSCLFNPLPDDKF